jgi:hypothetical protein
MGRQGAALTDEHDAAAAQLWHDVLTQYRCILCAPASLGLAVAVV